MLHHGSVRRVQIKEPHFMFKYSFLNFVLAFDAFHLNVGLLSFSFFFMIKCQISKTELFINQDKKSSVELCDDHSLIYQ